MTAYYMEPRDLPPGEEEYLSSSDLKSGEHSKNIYHVEPRPSNAIAMYLRGHIKPLLLNHDTFLALRRDFNQDNYYAWGGKEVTLSVSEAADISVRATVKYAPPAPKPSNDIASDLAEVLARAITTTHDRNNMISLLRGAADLLLARQ
jgi:hypothetical protein